MVLEYGSNVFTESSDNFAFKLGDDSGTAVSETVENTGFIDQSADTAIPVDRLASAAAALSTYLNKALVLDNTGDGEIAGNATGDSKLHIWITFRTHDTNKRIA